jgi:hypothetical protein
MTSPSLHWTLLLFFPGLLELFVCHRPMEILTKTSINQLLLWDGQQLVLKDHQLLIMVQHAHFICSISRLFSKHRIETRHRFDFVQLRLQGGRELWQICDGRQYLH